MVGVVATFELYGCLTGATSLVPLASRFYKMALATSSRKSYKTGEKHLQKFLEKFPKIPGVPFPKKNPSLSELTLCFFAAYLCTKQSIKSAATIKSYVRHAKNYWIELGCAPELLKSETLSRVLKGISRSKPKKRDQRPAFLLPHYNFPLVFRHPTSEECCVQSAAIIFGFFGMLRFHVFVQLHVNSLVLVDIHGREHKTRGLPHAKQKVLIFWDKIIGFYFDVKDKYHPVARVYFAKLADTRPMWKPICPLRALKVLFVYDLLEVKPFVKRKLSEAKLILAMKIIDRNDRDFKTHSLRIGAHTFFVTYGLPEDFVDFLGRRKVSRASSLYYRASARLTIFKLRRFAANFKFRCFFR